MIALKVILIMELGSEMRERRQGGNSMRDEYLSMLRTELDSIKERLGEA
jgi:hypothetical protein